MADSIGYDGLARKVVDPAVQDVTNNTLAKQISHGMKKQGCGT